MRGWKGAAGFAVLLATGGPGLAAESQATSRVTVRVVPTAGVAGSQSAAAETSEAVWSRTVALPGWSDATESRLPVEVDGDGTEVYKVSGETGSSRLYVVVWPK